ncbi:replication protein RepA [Corynebacterium casei]|uniref:replication protein RepA n=1 Tax=Corynebacterium casei TaxID=160386 RepID=UPI003FD2A58C
MSQSEEEKRLLAEATQKAREELKKKEALERSHQMTEKDKKALQQLEDSFPPISFAPVWFANFSLPHSEKQAKSTRSIEISSRELELINGDKKLTLYSRNGLPSGMYARKFLFWITTQAIKQKNFPADSGRYISVKSLRSMMNDMGISYSGGSRGTARILRAQINRVLQLSYYEDFIDTPSIDDYSNANIAERVFFQWEEKADSATELFEGSRIVLSHEFFDAIRNDGAVPLDNRILAKLSRSPLATDLYCWITYRLSYTHSHVTVTYDQLHQQFATGYPATKEGRRNFKKKMREAFAKVSKAWEEVTGERPDAFSPPSGCIILHKGGKPSVPKKMVNQIANRNTPIL